MENVKIRKLLKFRSSALEFIKEVMKVGGKWKGRGNKGHIVRAGESGREKPDGKTCFLKQMSTSCHSETQAQSSESGLCFLINPSALLSLSSVGSHHHQTSLLWYDPNNSSRFSSFGMSCVSHLLGLIGFFFKIFISFWISKVCSCYKIQKVQQLHKQKPETEWS